MADEAATDTTEAETSATEATETEQTTTEANDAPGDGAGADDADKSLINGGKGPEDEDEKGGEDEKEAAELPETYELEAPEGFEISADVLAEADPVFRELNLTNEQANKLMPLAGKFAERLYAQQQDAFQGLATDWAKQAKADEEIGGKNWSETETLVAKALDKFAGPKGEDNAFRQLLDETKLGNHPEMIRMFRRIGAALSEDGDLPRSDSGAPVKQDRLAVLYPNDVKEGAN